MDLVFRESVYWMPLASSISEASFLLLLIASKISASASSTFSLSVFFASSTMRKGDAYAKDQDTHPQLLSSSELLAPPLITFSPF